MRALGKVEYELRHYKASIDYLERSLVSTDRPLSAELRQDVQSLLHKALEYTATYALEIEPESAAVQVDGASVDLKAESRLVLEVGQHLIEARAPNHETARRTVTVAGGQDRVIRLKLLPKSEAAPAAPNESTRVDRPLRRKWWVWTGVSGAIAAAVVAGVVLSLRNSDPTTPHGGTSDTVLSLPQDSTVR